MIEQSTDIAELAKALAEAQGEFGVVEKTADNPFFKSKYADLPAVVQAATPILTKHGLSVTQMLGYEIDVDTLTTRLMHSSGQWIESTMRLHMTKQDAQGHGSAVTYARRYSYMAMLGLVSDIDDDGNAASVPPQPTTATSTAAKPVSTTTKRSAPKIDAKSGALRSLFAINDRTGNPVVPKGDDERHAWAGKILSRTVESFTDLSEEDLALLKKEAKAQAISSAPPAGATPDYTGDESPF